MNYIKTGIIAMLWALSGLVATPAMAQSVVMTRPVHVGDVTGLELSIEGALHAARGARTHWLVTVHEVVGLSDLRPSPRTRVRLLSSLVREHPMAEATTDELGRADLTFNVPVDAPGAFHVIFEAISPRNVRRQFDLDMTADPARAVLIEVDRQVVRRGAHVVVWGRVISNVTHQALPNVDGSLDLLDANNRPIVGRITFRTDSAGGFSHPIDLPSDSAGPFTAMVSTGEPEFLASARVTITTAPISVPTMIVRASAGQPIARPGESVVVNLVARTGDGRPVRNADVTCPLIPTDVGTGRQRSLRTDARGRAQFTFTAPEISVPYQDQPIWIQVTRTGLGTALVTSSVRIARVNLFATVAVEGGALIPGLHGRVFVRVVRADGSPAPAGVQIALNGPRFPAGLTAVTTADGAAVIDSVLASAPRNLGTSTPPGAGSNRDQDACGGGTATSFDLSLSQGTEHNALHGCVPLDPDATIRVRTSGSPIALPGGTLHVALERVGSIVRFPTELAILSSHDGTLVPIASQLLSASANNVDLTVPTDVRGLLIVRARPLYGPVAMPIRGGTALMWITQGQPFSVSASTDVDARNVAIRAEYSTVSSSASTEGTLVVLPREDGDALLERLRARAGSAPLGDLRVDPTHASDALVAGALAALARTDITAPAVLRDGTIVPVPAPDRPDTMGTLRDPWRTSARFVEGRLALLLQQIESHIASVIRTDRGSVAIRAPNGAWNFNREIFDAILSDASTATSTGPRALGGDALTIEILQRLDPALTYDNVARRITRRRLFGLLLALRTFVMQHSLDLRWSWRGDPSAWLTSLRTNGLVSEDDMLDGWGTPFALRATSRARFGFISPISGFEVVSAGSDQHLGTGDDIVDPFARVLPSGGAYARAVDEDGLLARLHGVELGRATIGRLAAVFAESSAYNPSSDSSTNATIRWDAIPSRVEADPHALDLVRPGLWTTSHVTPLIHLDATHESRVATNVDDEPRTYSVVVDAWNTDGYPASTAVRFAAGTPVLIDLPIAPDLTDDRPTIPRIRVGEAIRVAASVTNLRDTPQTLRLGARADGPIVAEAPASVRVGAGEVAEFEVTLRARSAGSGALALSIRDEQNVVLREVRAPIAADSGSVPLRDDVARVVRSATGSSALTLSLPHDRVVSHAQLVLSAPSALSDDPELDHVRHYDPALIAWAYTLSSREIPSSLAAALLQAQREDGRVDTIDAIGRASISSSAALSTSCAIVAWSAAPEDDSTTSNARTRAIQSLASLRGTIGNDGPAGNLREAAFILAALATGAQGSDGSSDEADPIASITERLRAELRQAAGPFSSQPGLLARAAAALLLSDPSDQRGVLLFDAARRAVVNSDEGARLRGGEARRNLGEELTATAALAIAAQQRGELSLATQLSSTVAAHAHQMMRLGGEATFWLLATTSYGVFGLGNPSEVELSIDGAGDRRVSLRNGRAVVPIAADDTRFGMDITIGGHDLAETNVLARLEVLSSQPYVSRDASPMQLNMQGDPGYSGETSALELTVQNRRAAIASRIVVEIQLPAAAALEPAARTALSQSGHVVNVEVRDGGIVRVVLNQLAVGESTRLPLAVNWLARGRVSGFAAVAYQEDEPSRMTMIPARNIELQPRPED